MRFRLRTLLILLAIMPPLLWIGWGRYEAWKAEHDRRTAMKDVFAPMTSEMDLDAIPIYAGSINLADVISRSTPAPAFDRSTDNRP